MDLIEQCYSYLFWGALVVLAVGILAALVYIIRARLTVDRIIGINLVGTIVVMVIVVLTFLLGEDYLADIALIYVVLSFIAVMMLCRIYINLYQRNQRKKEEPPPSPTRWRWGWCCWASWWRWASGPCCGSWCWCW